MAKTKTKPTGQLVDDFIAAFADTEQKQQDSYALIKLMQSVSGFEPHMWGPSIIGFGSYHYKYASGHEGDAPLLGFSPRKAAISLYVYTGMEEHRHLLDALGKYKIGKACIYIKRLSDIDEKQLIKLMKASIQYVKKKYGNNS
ncbi:MAG TPA: DUF1801 domain-containing protein [Ferruginibacter sp.]|nr:DUF1801 domain-containing protein [Ferruginibacter sp.]